MLSEETNSKFVAPKYIWFQQQLYELTDGRKLPEDRFVAHKEDNIFLGQKYTTYYGYKRANYFGDFITKKKKYYITNEDLKEKTSEVFLKKHRVIQDYYNVDKLKEKANGVISLNINGEMVEFERKEIRDKKNIEKLNDEDAMCFVKLKHPIGNKCGKNIIESMFYLQSKIDPTRKLMWRDFSVNEVEDDICIALWISCCLDYNDKDYFNTFYKKWKKKRNKSPVNDNNNDTEVAIQIPNSTEENDNNNLQNVIQENQNEQSGNDKNIQEEQNENSYTQNDNNINGDQISNSDHKSNGAGGNNKQLECFIKNNDVQQNNSGNQQQNNAVLPNNFYNQKIENNQFSILPTILPKNKNTLTLVNVKKPANKLSYQQTNNNINNITPPPNNIIPQPNNIMPKHMNYPPQNIITTQQAPLLRPIPIYRPNYYYMPTYYRPSRPLYRTWMHKYTDGWQERNQFNRYPYYFFYPPLVVNNTQLGQYAKKYYSFYPPSGVNNTQPGQYARTYYRPKRGLNGSI